MLEFVFTCKYHYVTGESCIYMVLHTCWVIVWIKCRQSGKCPVCSCVGALACWESKSTYHFYCGITYIASQMQSDLDFCNKFYNLRPKPSMREPRWATPRNRWLCIHLSTVTHHALLSRTMYDYHAKIMKLSGMMYARVCSQRQAYLP